MGPVDLERELVWLLQLELITPLLLVAVGTVQHQERRTVLLDRHLHSQQSLLPEVVAEVQTILAQVLQVHRAVLVAVGQLVVLQPVRGELEIHQVPHRHKVMQAETLLRQCQIMALVAVVGLMLPQAQEQTEQEQSAAQAVPVRHQQLQVLL